MINHKEQKNWQKIIDDSIYTMSALARKHGIVKRTMQAWLSSETSNYHAKPNKENRKKMLKAIKDAKKHPAPPFNKSYGYAYPEQIEALKEMGISPDRDRLVEEIRFQNRKKGKIFKEYQRQLSIKGGK